MLKGDRATLTYTTPDSGLTYPGTRIIVAHQDSQDCQNIFVAKLLTIKHVLFCSLFEEPINIWLKLKKNHVNHPCPTEVFTLKETENFSAALH